jgi:hypothetical protein
MFAWGADCLLDHTCAAGRARVGERGGGEWVALLRWRYFCATTMVLTVALTPSTTSTTIM